MGRIFDLCSATLKPAFLNDDGMPVHANAAGKSGPYGSCGYDSTILAPLDLQNSTAALIKWEEMPFLLNSFIIKMQLIDQTGFSSILLRILEFSSLINFSRGAAEHQATGLLS